LLVCKLLSFIDFPSNLQITISTGKAVPQLIELEESQLRELVNSRTVWRAFVEAAAEARHVRGSMVWKTQERRSYLIRKSPSGAQKSLGPRGAETEAIHDSFQQRKAKAQARLTAMKQRLEEQRKLNRVYRVGRTPRIVVRVLAALEAADLADKFIVIGTHAMYAYETAAGVLVESGALATQDLDLLFDARKRLAFAATLSKSEERSLIGVLKKADSTFRVRRSQLHTAVNDDGFEVDIVRRAAVPDDPHPLRMSDDENDFWAVQIDQGEKLASGRRFQHLVVASTGEMAMMRTVHPLDFIRLKLQLAQRPDRDPHKAPKDRLQAEVVQQLWDGYLHLLEKPGG
jgi:hypothetical protein